MPIKLTAFLVTLIFFMAGVVIIVRQMQQKSRIARKYGGLFEAKRSDLSVEDLKLIKRINLKTVAYMAILMVTYLCISLLIS